ncbi:MAG TPA: hypothetical protein VM490_21125 [Armatimonadaceae bacterium]|nr:hypothetical protein [Armatimonadaceae bacterium]
MPLDDGMAAAYAGYGGEQRGGEGALQVRFENGEAFAWGDTIQGTVIVPSLPAPARVALLTVSVVEQDVDSFVEPAAFATHGAPGGLTSLEIDPLQPAALETEYGSVVVARDFSLAPGGEPVVLPFSLRVPHGRSVTSGYFVSAHAAVSTDGSDLNGAEPFTLLPPRFVRALTASLETFGAFEPILLHNRPRAGGEGDFFDLNFAAPAELRDALDGVRFLVEEDGDVIRGEVEVNPQEHTLREHLASLFHADRVHFPVSFEREALNAAARDGRPAEEVVARLREILDPFLNRGGSDGPAAAPHPGP